MRKQEHTEIVDRCNHVRERMKMNHTGFARRIGMKVQSWSNFVNKQGSKPSVELVRGVIREFGVNPYWLLFGDDPMFTEGTPLPPESETPGIPAGTGELTDRLGRLEREVASLMEAVLYILDSTSVDAAKRRHDKEPATAPDEQYNPSTARPPHA